jgi:hypothetical protein
MKKLIWIALLLVSFVSLADEYSCDVRRYNLEIDLEGDRSTHIWVRDTQTHSTIFQNYAGSIERGQKVTSFFFYGDTETVIISFRNIDIESQKPTIKGHIEAFFDGFILNSYITCSK